MLRSRAVAVSPWKAVLLPEVLRLPEELAEVDARMWPSRPAGRLRKAVNDMIELLEVTRRVANQTRQRVAGTTPAGADPPGQPARRGRPADREGPAR